ncbi:MAG: F-box protein, partial [Deltaproteobacteria bacterium]
MLRLPRELLSKIGSCLHPDDALSLAASCQVARDAVAQPETWEGIGRRETATVGGLAMALAPRSNGASMSPQRAMVQMLRAQRAPLVRHLHTAAAASGALRCHLPANDPSGWLLWEYGSGHLWRAELKQGPAASTVLPIDGGIDCVESCPGLPFLYYQNFQGLVVLHERTMQRAAHLPHLLDHESPEEPDQMVHSMATHPTMAGRVFTLSNYRVAAF